MYKKLKKEKNNIVARNEAMILFFLCVLFGIFLLFCIFILLLSFEFKIKNLDFMIENINKKHVNDNFIFTLYLKLFRIPVFKVDVTRATFRKNKVKIEINKMKQKIRQEEKKLDFKMIAQLKKLKINFKSLNFVVNIGTEDAAVTALTTGVLATSIGIALRNILNLNKDNYFKDGYNTIYLKADYTGGGSCSTSYDASQTLIKRMNPLWATKGNTVAAKTTTISNQNEQAAAWLCDPSKWTAYCDTDKANYAIGGPSVEMYVKSYNQTHGDDALGCQYQTNTVPGYIYKVKDTIQNSGWYTNDNTLDYSMTYKSMYCGQNGKRTGSWWLASPSAHSSISVCDVGGSNARLYGNNYYYDDVVSPLVSLKSSFIPEIEE